MKPMLLRLLLAGSLGCAASLPAAVIEGRVKLPAGRKVTVVNKRYEIVANGGVLTVNPPIAVVYLEGTFPPAAIVPVAQLVQKDLVFIPALLPIRKGTRVEFPNLDDVYHNVFSYSPAKQFDLGRYRPDERPVPSQVFETPGLVTLRCDVHEHMRAVILVLDTPHFVVTGEDGCFRITDVPPGKYTLKAWIDSRTIRAQPVDITEESAVLRIDFP